LNLYRRQLARAVEVQRTRDRLLRDGFPRVQMFILVALTGLAGFLASFLMLLAGVDGMALRYVLATAAAYTTFMLLLWLWLRTSADDYIPDFGGGGGGGSADAGAPSAAGPPDFAGGGGTFDGGGASGNADFPSGSLGDGSGVADLLSGPADAVASADEAAVPLAIILLAATLALAVVGIALSSLFVVWSAPMLFAEISVDALLSAGLYRRLRHLEPRHWMRAAVRRTIVPFLLTTVAVGAAGFGMQHFAPDAHSIGQVMHRAVDKP
jgi:hypothetical protein